jgi:hypothetical protein
MSLVRIEKSLYFELQTVLLLYKLIDLFVQ